MMLDAGPDVLCFATHPEIRMRYVDLAVRHGVRGLSMEKPMALSLGEAREMKRRLDGAGIQAVVSQQMKYYGPFQRLKRAVDAREFGEITGVLAETTPWMHILGTHFIDYILWITGAGGARWAAGHVQGRDKLSDNHASPDFLMGVVLLENGLRARIECGYLSEPHLPEREFWVDDRLTVHGLDGYAWAEPNGRFGLCAPSTGGRLRIEQGPDCARQEPPAQVQYYRDFHAWLEGGPAHPCHFDQALAGYEILTAMCLSGLDNRRADLPLGPEGDDVIGRLRRELPEQAVPEELRRKGFFEHWGS